MSKSVLILDTPDNCIKCKLRYEYRQCEVCILADDIIEHFYETGTKPDWCPLSPFPSKRKQLKREDAKSIPHAIMYMYNQGWNDCIDEIMKGLKNEHI